MCVMPKRLIVFPILREINAEYLKPEKILQIAKKTGAAIHPGYGFLSQNADFARRCEEEGVIFIGPSADIIARMGGQD